MRRPGARGLVFIISILIFGIAISPAQTDEPGPFERFFRSLRHGFNEPHHKSEHRVSHKKTEETTASPGSGSNNQSVIGGVGAPPTEQNTRTASRAVGSKGSDLSYGTPVPGKPGLVTSPYAPNSGYIDVRGFAPGTPVKDPYTGKIFLTP
jgi:hypothetical protein